MDFGARTTCKKVFLGLSLFSVLSAPCFGEGQGGGGDVLFGLAAITSAASPAVVAGIQAGADVSIARTNAGASVTQAKIAADVSKYQTASIERTTMMQNMAALNINRENNKGQTERLGMMLAEQAASRNQAYALRQDEMKYEYSLKRQELQMAEIQREENYKLAVMKMEAERVIAGYSTGFSRVNTVVEKASPLNARASASTTSTIGSQVNRALIGRGKLFSALDRRGAKVSDRLLGFGLVAQGSTRVVRQRVSDLSAFQASVAPARAIASDEGYRRHRMREDDERNTDEPSHR